MKFRTGLFIAAGACILTGALIGGIAVANGGLEAEKGVRQERQIVSDISKIDISANMGDITIVRTDKDYINLVYYETGKKKYDVTDDNNMVKVKPNNTQMKWYDYINIGLAHGNDITLELPNTFIGDIVIDSKMGDVDMSGVSGNVNISLSYGDIKVSSCEKIKLICADKCGDIELENILGSIEANSKLGDIEFKNISGDISLKNACGDIEGTIMGREEEYTVNAKTSVGDNNLQDRSGGTKKLDIKNDCGDIEVRFVG